MTVGLIIDKKQGIQYVCIYTSTQTIKVYIDMLLLLHSMLNSEGQWVIHTYYSRQSVISYEVCSFNAVLHSYFEATVSNNYAPLESYN